MIFGVGAGARTDLDSVRTLIASGASEREIADNHFGTWCRNYRAFERYRVLTVGQRTWQTEIKVYYGPTGSGKSRRALEEGGPEAYWLPMPNVRGGAVWWDGYHSQDTVIIEEFSGWMRIQFVLRLFDRYPMQVQPKSGSVTFVAKKIIVTSNYPPSVWWRNIGLGLPMVRRLTPPIGTVEYIGNAEYPTAAE